MERLKWSEFKLKYRNYAFLFVISMMLTMLAYAAAYRYAFDKYYLPLIPGPQDKFIIIDGRAINVADLYNDSVVKMLDLDVNYSSLLTSTTTKATFITTTLSTSSATCLSVTTTTSTTLPGYTINTGGGYYSTKPTSFAQKWKMCNPMENVTYSTSLTHLPIDMNVTNCTDYNVTDFNETTVETNCTTYEVESLECSHITNSTKVNCTEYFKGTDYTRSYLLENDTRTIRGGCAIEPTSCCSCENGGQIDAINLKYYRQMYSETLGNCSKNIICPMQMRSKIGCHASASCLEGICQIVNR